MSYLTLGSRTLIGVIFLVSAIGKMRSPSTFMDFSAWVARLTIVPGRASGLVAATMILAEVTVVALLLPELTVRTGLAIAALILAIMTAATSVILRRGIRESCRCFGASKLPLGRRHLWRNLALFACAVIGVLNLGENKWSTTGVALTLTLAVVVAVVVIFADQLAGIFGDLRDLVDGRIESKAD